MAFSLLPVRRGEGGERGLVRVETKNSQSRLMCDRTIFDSTRRSPLSPALSPGVPWEREYGFRHPRASRDVARFKFKTPRTVDTVRATPRVGGGTRVQPHQRPRFTCRLTRAHLH